MEPIKIPEAERLFRLLGTYQNMKSMLDIRNTSPVAFRLQAGRGQYVTADDPEGVELFETLVNTRIEQLQDAITEL